MNDDLQTFESVTSSALKVLKEDLHRTDGTLESYSWKWNRLKRFMETPNLQHLTADVCDNFLLCVYSVKDFNSLGTGDKKLISSIRLLKHFLLTGEIIPRKAPVIFVGEIGNLMIQYMSYRKSERLTHHTVYNQEVHLSRFLNFLSSKKVTSIKVINESHIIK